MKLRRAMRIVVLAACVALPTLLAAQISPGPLSEPHAQLEGNDQCLRCHSQRKRVSGDLCLECHKVLRERIQSRRGFHATIQEQGCEQCHMEHHGSEFELVWWGDQGQESFDHRRAGYLLEGAHRDLACQRCHRPELIGNPDSLERQDKDLARTFLGLDASHCEACHRDPHVGRFTPGTCDRCHGAETWKSVPGFRHEETRFPLLGKHQNVACDRCHPLATSSLEGEPGSVRIQLAGFHFGRCTDCHRDPHQSRLGSECQRCHSEEGWRAVELEGFDHRRTRFALEGAHVRVGCAKCHRTGSTYRVARFQACTDCHQDLHLGQFADRPDGGICTACHDDEAFTPSSYTLQAHQSSGYPLEGSHLAVPCDACHQRVEGRQITVLVGNRLRSSKTGLPQSIIQFAFPSTTCSACHRDPHQGAVERFTTVSGCGECHDLAGWRSIHFDHEKTEYRLEAGHQKPSCRECHAVEPALHLPADLRFAGVAHQCTACHVDEHAGQFANRQEPEFCRDCHSLAAWRETVFDHNRNSRYILDGVHAKVDCRSCHPAQEIGGREVVRYRPLAMGCADCHSGTRPVQKTVRSR